MTKKNRGPSLVPWGTPAKMGNQVDLSWPILTRRWRFLRKAAHQFSRMGGTLRSWSLRISMLWSMRSKAFTKSMRHALIMAFGVSAAWSHS